MKKYAMTKYHILFTQKPKNQQILKIIYIIKIEIMNKTQCIKIHKNNKN